MKELLDTVEYDYPTFHLSMDCFICKIKSGNLVLKEHEAAELLEVFQWSAADVDCEDKIDKIKEELADVVSYCILMADTCGLDLDEIISEKVKRNNEKYPIEKAFGSKEKYTQLK